jgi:hypothetical protein
MVGMGEGDESGVCGKACRPEVETGDEVDFGPGIESGSSGGPCTAVSGVEMGDGLGAWAPSGHVRAADKLPTTIRKFFTGTDFLIGILVQYL